MRGGGKGNRVAAASGAPPLGHVHLLSDEDEEGSGEDGEGGVGDVVGLNGRGGEESEGGVPGRGALTRGSGLSDPAEAISLLDQVRLRGPDGTESSCTTGTLW